MGHLGVDHAAIESYSPIKDSDDVKEYLVLVGRPLDERQLSQIWVSNSALEQKYTTFEDTKPEELVFEWRLNQRQPLFTLLSLTTEIWGLESTRAYKKLQKGHLF